jgi:hypothetical protein
MDHGWSRAARWRAAAAMVALAAAACSGGVAAPPLASQQAIASAGGDAAVVTPRPATPAATAPAGASSVLTGAASAPPAPPQAVLEGVTGGRAAGDLGSYTWGGSGSDAPWIVARDTATVTAGVNLQVVFDAATPQTWTAAWAPVTGGVAGVPTGAISGAGAMAVGAPPAGDWTLRATVAFGPAHNATYYWHLTVSP